MIEQIKNSKQKADKMKFFGSINCCYNDEVVANASLRCLKNIIKFFSHQFSYDDFNVSFN